MILKIDKIIINSMAKDLRMEMSDPDSSDPKVLSLVLSGWTFKFLSIINLLVNFAVGEGF